MAAAAGAAAVSVGIQVAPVATNLAKKRSKLMLSFILLIGFVISALSWAVWALLAIGTPSEKDRENAKTITAAYAGFATAVVAIMSLLLFPPLWGFTTLTFGLLNAFIYDCFFIAVMITGWILYVRINKREDIKLAQDLALGAAIVMSIFIVIFFMKMIKKIRKYRNAHKLPEDVALENVWQSAQGGPSNYDTNIY